jgi:hypothetical protein
MSEPIAIRRHVDSELAAPGFSEWDDQIMKDVFGERLWKAGQNLLITQSEIARIAGSFGSDAVNAKVLLERIQRELKSFREAAIDKFNDQ